MVLGSLSSALPVATRPAPSYKSLSPLPAITIFPPEAFVPSPPASPLAAALTYRVEVGKVSSRGALALLLCIRSQLAQPWCITLTKDPLPTSLSATGGEREEEGDEEPSHELIAC